MGPYPTITSYPPLGQLTLIPAEQEEVTLTILIEWNTSRPNYPFELVLCYTSSIPVGHVSNWANFSLQSKNTAPLIVGTHDEARRSVFEGVLGSSEIRSSAKDDNFRHITFTLKYRVNEFAPWQWVQTQNGTQPGELIFQKHLDVQHSILSMLQLEPDWQVSRVDVDSRVAAVFRLESLGAIPVDSPGAGLETQILGKVPNQLRCLSIVRLEPYWLGPRHCKDHFYVSEEAIVSSFLTKDGQILTLVALSGIDDVYTVLKSNGQGQIVVASRNSGETNAQFLVLAATSSSFEASLAAAMTEARKLVNESTQIQLLAKKTSDIVKASPLDSRVVEDWLDGLTYCTWNGITDAVADNLTADKILTGLDELEKNGISISTLIIDDNWQTLGPTEYDYSNSFRRGWATFEANKNAFPNGLKESITQIRRQHPNVQDIGVWHALFGYWAGIAPGGQIAKDYQTTKVDVKMMGNVPGSITSIAASDLHKFYNDFYSWLSLCGITFVKTDVQHMQGELMQKADRAALTSTYQSAWTCAYLRHFSGKAISCMSQIPQTLFHSQLQTHTPRILLRNSDDFYPEVTSSHPWHLWANAHNSLFTQHLNVLPDWDMFQSSHAYSAYHGAARCLSGGPVIITDTPGQHDAKLLGEMTAPAPNGRTIALRPNVGKTTRVFDEYTEGNVLKIGTFTGEGVGSASSASLLGLFNVSDRQINFMLPFSDFPGASERQGKMVVRSHMTSQIFGPSNLDQLLYLILPVRGYEILTAYAVQTVQVGSTERYFCVLGLLQKMTGAAAVTGSSVSASEDGKVLIKVSLKAVGKLGIWMCGSDAGLVSVMIQGKSVGEDNLKVTTLDEGTDAAQLLEVDVLEAWKEYGAQKKDLKEIEVKIILG